MTFRNLLLLTTVFILGALPASADGPGKRLDFDGDRLDDLVQFNPSTRTFRVRGSSNLAFASEALGSIGDMPLTADFDGDGKADYATFNRTSATWTIKRSSDGAVVPVVWGEPGDIAVPGRFADNDCDALAFYNPRRATFTIANCVLPLPPEVVSLGAPGGVPFADDFDGDGVDDPGVYNPQTTRWTIRHSKDGTVEQFFFGLPGDHISTGNFIDNGMADAIVYRPTSNQFFVRVEGGEPLVYEFGKPGDFASLADVDGDGRMDFVGYRPMVDTFDTVTSLGFLFPDIAFASLAIPADTDPVRRNVPVTRNRSYSSVPGDVDRDAESDFTLAVGLERIKQWYVRGIGASQYAFLFGLTEDVALMGDIDGDLAADPVVVREREDGGLNWYVKSAAGVLDFGFFGLKGDTPLLGDVDCDGKKDFLVVRNQGGLLNWYAKTASGAVLGPVPFGLAGDEVWSADIDGIGCDYLVVTRKESGGIVWHMTNIDGTGLHSLQWGLADRDTAMPPMDFDGNKLADPVVIRNDGGVLTAYIRLSDTLSKVIPLGTGGIPVGGFFSGVNKAEMAMYTPSESGVGNVRLYKFNGQVENRPVVAVKGNHVIVTPGGKSEAVVTAVTPPPASTPTTPIDDGSNGTANIQCDVRKTFKDGRGGALYKHISEGVHGHPVVLLPRSYKDAPLEVFDRNGRKSGVIRTKCCPNGNRMHWWLAQKTSALARVDPLTIRVTKNGRKECYPVPKADSRID